MSKCPPKNPPMVVKAIYCVYPISMMDNKSKARRLTTIASIHICDQRGAKWIEVGDHLSIFAHLVQLRDSQVWLAKAGSRGSCAGLFTGGQLRST